MKHVFDANFVHRFDLKDLQKEIVRASHNSIYVIREDENVLTYIIVKKEPIDKFITNSTNKMKKTKKVAKKKAVKAKKVVKSKK